MDVRERRSDQIAGFVERNISVVGLVYMTVGALIAYFVFSWSILVGFFVGVIAFVFWLTKISRDVTTLNSYH